MHVLAAAEGGQQQLVAAQVGHDPQLDLGVIGRHETPAGRGDERPPDLLPLLGADGNVLEVGIGAGQAAGGRDSLVERGVQTACRGIDQRRQRVHVSGLEFGQLPVVQDAGGQRVQRGQRLQHLDPGGVRLGLLRLLGRGELELVEQNLAELLRRVDIELLAGQRKDFLLQLDDPAGQFGGE